MNFNTGDRVRVLNFLRNVLYVDKDVSLDVKLTMNHMIYTHPEIILHIGNIGTVTYEDISFKDVFRVEFMFPARSWLFYGADLELVDEDTYTQAMVRYVEKQLRE